MNAAFNTGFVDNQSAAEQLFNRASLREFHGQKIGNEVDQAIRRFERSVDGLDRAMVENGELMKMLETNRLLPEFEAALTKHLSALAVSKLPLVTLEPAQPANLADVLRVIQSQFQELKEMTKRAITATHELDPKIDNGQFVAAVLQADSRFNQDKIALGFGRDKVESFVSTACHATILAVEDTWPMAFGFLTEPKAEAREATPEPERQPAEKRDSGDGGLSGGLIGLIAILVVAGVGAGFFLGRRRT